MVSDRVRAGRGVVAVLATLGVLGCGINDDVTGLPEEVTFAPELGVDLNSMQRLPSGVYIKDLVTGTGDEVMSDSNIEVTFRAWLVNGRQVDGGNLPCFPLAMLIQGWQDGIPGMLVGGKRKLVVPPTSAYGKEGSFPSIPPNATLVFDVELTAVPPSCS